MQALILAAGMGSRIRDTHALPKGFLSFSDHSIIQESIEKIKQCGIQKILIVTGYSANYFDELAKQDANVTTIYNNQFAQYGNLYSWYCAKDYLTDDFLLLESDIIYEKKALDQLLDDTHPNTIILSGTTQSGDEVYVQTTSKNNLVNMRKKKDALVQQDILGEFVGISKIALLDYQRLMQQALCDKNFLHTGYYDEQGIVAMTKFCEVYCLKDPSLLWAEIDDKVQYERAKKLYPIIDRVTVEEEG
ncbi:MAG: Nucleotidyl transferase [uncultured bacterium]|nr:MAG: Nucleotidyl transferase [uncultured bacterium]OGT26213.1 MAG: hypothetical protein A3B71_06805 [Gammaproteobacteria bacterium RIFCSPHIGHO2_02_FULL_42_43]OGT28513.1 MAG: hypothetical protein A2624_00875 [Gammaproteobacteria bacterium RIFCSPHIGHO2_01_FULL_42_8]OGT52590.1 MAG: hypothetical protein A3E54_06405 [Gammaproteobacteria bacterium RIFCSPHIGHO2_12_FULL_41_25]OGT63188.1 MAG: hypothetical protein A3I77_06210 [Gammaproteobacteria bacterium RIFCSPLOWO2_02_FULL_42_14]OGT86689.1 MAG: hy